MLFFIILVSAFVFIGGIYLLCEHGLEWIVRGGPCSIYKLTGWYCPGCGGTRAVKALFKGHILKSIYYHPAVAFIALWSILFMIKQLLHYASKGRIKSLELKDWHIWVAATLFLINFMIKNAQQFL